ncbi:MAG: TAXI family TRAP transporter solute-binding subunit [Rhizobiaceae bacterium]|nr:TAXI family TRAP transporter solute-binding subunit [Rhizobiaceae bacterium]
MKTLLKTFAAGAFALGLTGSALSADNELKMATIAPGSSAYLTMTTMATLVNQSLDDVNISVDATGAATKHMIEVAEGKLDFAMTAPTIYKFMKEGTVMYSQLENSAELAENLRLVLWFPLGQYHITTYADDGMMTPADIKGKRVFLGPPGGGAWAAARDWVKILTGFEPDTDYENVKASWSSALQGFQDRQFDVYVTTGIAPFPQIEQLSLTSDLRLLGLTKEEFEANEEAQEYTRIRGEEIGIIPAGVYGSGVVNTEDVYTLAAAVGVTARADLDDDLVYRITKAYWEAKETAAANNPWLRDITLEYALQDGGMSLHPGALRYYEEIGVDIPEGSR